MEHGLIYDVALCIIAAWVLAVGCHLCRQPLILAYLAAGFTIGPNGFRWVTNPESINTISSLGLILLLFMIGLEMDLRKMFSAGKAITITATTQIVGCIGLGLGFFWITGLGSSRLEVLYLAVAAAMSSTVIIVKMLYDRRELETLAGRVTLGVMVLQDLATILFLAIQPNLNDPAVGQMLLALGKVILLVGLAYVVSRFLLPPIFRFVARQPELVLVGALAWCFALAGLAGELGLSREMGALIAGVMVSTFPYTLDVAAKVTSLRDFFVTLFFVGLGMTIPIPTVDLFGWTVVFSGFILVSRFLTTFLPLYWLGSGHRISVLPALNLSQMSELSLVLLTIGKLSGDVSNRVVSVAAFTFAFLAVVSTYGMAKSNALLRFLSPWLTRFGFRDLGDGEGPAQERQRRRIFILGFSWAASSLLEEITRERPALLPDLCVLDFNPVVHQRLRHRGVCVVYGDISQRDVLVHAGIEEAEIILCTLPDTILKGASNQKMLRQVRELNSRAQVVVHAENLTDVPQLYDGGASYVTTPRLLEATELIKVLDAAAKGLLDEKRKEQLSTLQHRQEVVP